MKKFVSGWAKVAECLEFIVRGLMESDWSVEGVAFHFKYLVWKKPYAIVVREWSQENSLVAGAMSWVPNGTQDLRKRIKENVKYEADGIPKPEMVYLDGILTFLKTVFQVFQSLKNRGNDYRVVWKDLGNCGIKLGNICEDCVKCAVVGCDFYWENHCIGCQ